MLNLLFQLASKDLKTRYAHLGLGFFWALLSPLMMTAILYVVFSLFLKVTVEGAPFFLYLATATFSWKFFQDSLLSSVSSLRDNKNLIRESKFPQYLLPLSIVLANAILFLPSLVILTAVAWLCMGGLPAAIVFLPLAILGHLLITAGIAVVVSVLYVKFRDLKHILDTLMPFLFYLTPAFYSLEMVRASLSPLLFKAYLLNPFVGMLTLYRVMILKDFHRMPIENGYIYLIVVPFVFGAAVLIAASYIYEKRKNSINDYLAY